MKVAEANKIATVQDAEAAAEATIRAGNAERDRQLAEAKALEALGLARAAAARAEGLAQAEATHAQAEALREQGEAVLAQQVIALLPEIVRAAAEPIGSIDQLTVVSTDGASAMTRTVGQVLGEGQEVIKSLTGMDLNALVSGIAGRAVGTDGARVGTNHS